MAIVSGSSSSAHASSVPMMRPPNSVPGIGLGTEPVARMTVFASISVPSKLPPTLTLPSSVTRAVALDVVDLVLLEQARDAAGQRLDDLRAALHDLGEVDRALGDGDAEVVGLVDLGEHVGDAQDGLGGDAGVVEAAAPDDVALDDGGLHAELRGADGGDVAARARSR